MLMEQAQALVGSAPTNRCACCGEDSHRAPATGPVVYENARIDTGFHAKLIVEDKVIVETQSVEWWPRFTNSSFDLAAAGLQVAPFSLSGDPWQTSALRY